MAYFAPDRRSYRVRVFRQSVDPESCRGETGTPFPMISPRLKAVEQTPQDVLDLGLEFNCRKAGTFDLGQSLIQLYRGSDADVAIGANQIALAGRLKHLADLIANIACPCHCDFLLEND